MPLSQGGVGCALLRDVCMSEVQFSAALLCLVGSDSEKWQVERGRNVCGGYMTLIAASALNLSE